MHNAHTRSSQPISSTCPVALRWEDLPGTVLAHLLQLAPYKRPDVKLVCTSWRAAVNAAMKTVSLPAEDLDLLHQLTAVQALTVGTPHPPGEQQSLLSAAHACMGLGEFCPCRRVCWV